MYSGELSFKVLVKVSQECCRQAMVANSTNLEARRDGETTSSIDVLKRSEGRPACPRGEPCGGTGVSAWGGGRIPQRGIFPTIPDPPAAPARLSPQRRGFTPPAICPA